MGGGRLKSDRIGYYSNYYKEGEVEERNEV